MDQQSKGSTIVCQDQETQHIEEEKATEDENFDKILSKTDNVSKCSSIGYQDQETQHIEDEKVNITENIILHQNLSNTDRRQGKSNSMEFQDQESQKETNIADELKFQRQLSNTHQLSKGKLMERDDQETLYNNITETTNLEKQLETQHIEETIKIVAEAKKHSNTVQQSKSNPIPCQDQETQHARERQKETIKESTSRLEMLKEVAIKSIDLNVATSSNAPSLQTSLISKKSCIISSQPHKYKEYDPMLPVIVINSPANRRSPITIQPSRTFLAIQSSISPQSLITVLPNQPQSLFLQALAKLNQSSLSLAILNKSLKSERTETENPDGTAPRSPELTPPDSLTSAPPSYSFVLRQSAARRRPRLMGTFIPSPSFVTKTPPPNYAAAFDIYVDSPLPPQPTRIYHFGFSAMPIICPECGYVGLTAVTTKITLCTHLCALLLCLFCCWVCAPLPYVMSSCKDVYHYCRNCRNFLGMYSPSNPETPYPVG